MPASSRSSPPSCAACLLLAVRLPRLLRLRLLLPQRVLRLLPRPLVQQLLRALLPLLRLVVQPSPRLGCPFLLELRLRVSRSPMRSAPPRVSIGGNVLFWVGVLAGWRCTLLSRRLLALAWVASPTIRTMVALLLLARWGLALWDGSVVGRRWGGKRYRAAGRHGMPRGLLVVSPGRRWP